MEPQSPHPKTIGRFVVESVLGTGGMGAVYKCSDPTLKREVAVKIVRPGLDNPELLDRLLREAQACARLHHKNIVTIYEAGQIDGTVFIVMEYLVGESLATILGRGTLPFEETLQILVQVLDALEHVHRAGIIHRDIKPGNIYREQDGTIKLVDFGLARNQQAEAITMTGMFMATPGYASPEQFRGETVDARTDVYSTGVVAYEMISGHRPFAGDLSSLLYKVVHEPPPPMNVVWSRTYPDVERIITKALAKAPDERYQTAAGMRDDLKAFIARSAAPPTAVLPALADPHGEKTTAPVDLTAKPTPKTIARPGAKPAGLDRRLVAAAAIVLLLILIGGWFAFRESGNGSTAGTAPAATPTAPAVRDAAPPAATRDVPASPATTADIPPPVAAPPLPPLASESTPPPARAGDLPARTTTDTSSTTPPAVTAPETRPPAPARSSSPSAVNPATQRNIQARCDRLRDRASIGETLAAADRDFLIKNCR